MFFIHDHQPEALESDVARQEPVRTDDDVHRAVRQPGGHPAHVLCASEARQQFHPDRPGAEPVRERAVVLLDEQGGGRQQRGLVAGLRGDEGCAQRHLRLAEPHVTADHPVHRAVARQVLDDIVDGLELVIGFPERKLQGKALVQVIGQAERNPAPRGPPGVEFQQFRGRVPRLLGGLALRLEPLIRTQPVQRRLFRRRAGVSADQVQAVHGYVELVRVGVLQHQELGHRPVHFEVLETPITPDAVLFVHHGGADAQVGQVADDGFRVPRRTAPPSALPGPVQAQLLGGHDTHGPVRQDQARIQFADAERQRRVALEEFPPTVHRHWPESPACQEFLHHLAAARRGSDNERSRPAIAIQPARDRVRVLGGGRVQGVLSPGIEIAVPGTFLKFTGGQFQYRKGRDSLQDFRRFPEGQLRLENGPLRVAVKLLMALPDQVRPRFQSLPRPVHQHDQRIGRQVVRQRHGRIEEQRQVVLDTGGQLGIGNVPVDRSAGRFAGHMFPEAPPEVADVPGIEGKFPRRQDANLRYPVRTELGVRIEEPQVLDFVVEEIDPDRAFRPGRKDIDERAPDRKISGIEYLLDMQVPLADESFPKRPDVKPVACLQHQRPAGDEIRRRQPVQQRLGVDDERFRAAGDKAIENRESFGKQLRRRRERVVRKRFIVAKAPQTHVRRKELQFLLHRIGSRCGAGDDAYRSPVPPKNLACRKTTGGTIELPPAYRSRCPGRLARQFQIRENPVQEKDPRACEKAGLSHGKWSPEGSDALSNPVPRPMGAG